ncbi:MAG: OmpP1/FadL family transporter [Tangfeifania sp.]
MKKLTFIAAFFMLFQVAFAGGLLTNTNQSAQFIRMMSRNASNDIDAVYFNPAGLVHLEDGWHFAFHSQTIFQTKTVDSKFPLLNNGVYEGVVEVPVFPSAYAVYKEDSWAFSLGFGPNAGGGSAKFDRGLPSFEIPITKVVPGLAGLTQIDPNLNVTGYSAELSFEGTSVFWGIQLGATYLVNDVLSVYGGVRYLPARNAYQGTIRSIQLEVNDQLFPAPAWLLDVSGSVQGMADMAGGAAANVDPLIQAGAGDNTLPELEAAGVIDPTTRASLEQGLMSFGVENPSQLTVNQVQQTFLGAETQLSGTASTLTATSEQLVDKEVDTEQTGAGFTPMIGVEIAPNENWNIALKYEMKTNLELTNNTAIDDLDLFPDEAPSRNDLPAILAAGVGYRNDRLEAQLSYNMYFNKGAGWGPNTQDIAVWQGVDDNQIRNREIDRNGMEVGLGLQYNVTDEFAFSVGGLWGDQGVADSYQSDFSYSNPSVTAGAGIEWLITDQLILDAGFSNTFYQDQTVTFTDPDVSSYSQTMGKTAMTFAVGLSYAIF